MTLPGLNYAVLGVALIFESTSLFISRHRLLRGTKSSSMWRRLRASKDPSVFTIVAEDTAAVAGILVAFVGVALSQVLGLPVLSMQLGPDQVLVTMEMQFAPDLSAGELAVTVERIEREVRRASSGSDAHIHRARDRAH